ncbi:S-adenosyl-L-methionine-dependent methyltransferase [Schizopora paradoxa]|uniref:S-adenosyl-L-methionine-dependent methyltransferase n=1 Tax=Schizopora paradoxa TaxID=27342 RepID=A0A0H2RNL1_9AGAM|nr:S-adenosyl-L-methionine-dependent methyltransferase [Schizopora paradoxa]
MKSKSTIRALAELILQNVDALEEALEKRGASVPSLDDPFTPGSDIANGQPELMATTELTVRAASQLIQTIRMPQYSVIHEALSHTNSSTLRVVTELNISEILKEAGPDGLHISEIAKKCNADPVRLCPIIRYLCGRWIFREVTPDVFTNNRLSSVLDKGKSVAELQKSPESKFDTPQSAISALVGHLTDESMKGGSYLYEVLSEPDSAFKAVPELCATTKSLGSDLSLWDFYELPEQKYRHYRFGVAMEGVKNMEPAPLPLGAFDWGSLPEDSLVVDVGGGVGTVSTQLASVFPKLRLVVQDRPAVIEDGKKRWKGLNSVGQVSFEAHDFFKPNPIKKPAVFLLKHITHDWADSYVKTILQQLREAAGPDTKLVVMDRIIPFACPIPEEHTVAKIPGLLNPQLPWPLTVAGPDQLSTKTSVLMTILFNSTERTLQDAVDLYASAGWKIVKVNQFEAAGSLPSGIVAVPI